MVTMLPDLHAIRCQARAGRAAARLANNPSNWRYFVAPRPTVGVEDGGRTVAVALPAHCVGSSARLGSMEKR
jgi:hypothetical protein